MKRLRIFYAASHSPNPDGLQGSELWRANLYNSLVEMGHEVTVFDYDMTEHFKHLNSNIPADQNFIAEHRPILEEQLTNQLIRAHHQKPLDLFFSYFYDACATPSAIQEIKRLGIPTVNFYCNAVHQFHLVATIAPHYDWCMVPEKEALPKYRAAGANPIHVQMAANPITYRPYDVPCEYDVTFVGQRYLNRAAYLSYLFRNGVDVRVWGPRWREPKNTTGRSPRRLAGRAKRSLKALLKGTQPVLRELPAEICGPPLPDEDLIRLYSSSKISLGFSEVKDYITGSIKRHIRLRDFEGPMSGALYFTGYQEELEDYYRIGREIICYDTKEELLDKVRYYLRHETEARKIREAGLMRARQDHTWRNRFRQLFTEIGMA